jgi:cell cycle sensor histidine kinase DivJ
MSHELRTPLNAIIGFSEMIARERELSLGADKRQEYARLINDSGQHLLAVVNDILNMSKIESGTFELEPHPFDAREVVANCCDLMALRARETGVDLVMNLSDSLPKITGDKRAFKQILINLLSNAIKFTDRGGRVSVAMVEQGTDLVLSVQDTGIGIDGEDLRKLGEAFFQAGRTYDRRHEGTGLGLSIVKGLVGLHNGELRFESRLGEGTKVTVLLPLEFVPSRKSAGANVTNFGPPRADEPHPGVRRIA